MRRDILTKKNQGTVQPPPAKHPFRVLSFQRLLTKKNPAGKPSLELTQLTGTADLLKLDLEETVILEDENKAQIMHLIEYNAHCVTGQDLVANTQPDRVLTLACPVAPSAPHEPGLPMRLGYEIQSLYGLQDVLGDDEVEMPPDFIGACSDQEARLVEWLDLIVKIEKRFYLRNK